MPKGSGSFHGLMTGEEHFKQVYRSWAATADLLASFSLWALSWRAGFLFFALTSPWAGIYQKLRKSAEWTNEIKTLNSSSYSILMGRLENNHNSTQTSIDTIIWFISKIIRILERGQFLLPGRMKKAKCKMSFWGGFRKAEKKTFQARWVPWAQAKRQKPTCMFPDPGIPWAGELWAWWLQVKVRVRPTGCQGEYLDSNTRPVGNCWEFLSREWIGAVLGKQRHKNLVTEWKMDQECRKKWKGTHSFS